MLQSSLPTVVFDTGFTDRQPEHLPSICDLRFTCWARLTCWLDQMVAEVGVAPTEGELMGLV